MFAIIKKWTSGKCNVSEIISRSWSAETSATPDKWCSDNPALGQCAISACIIQDYLGGDILNCTVILPDGTIDSHYFNIIDDEEIDITKRQFPIGSQFSDGQPKTKGYVSTREYCLSYESTNKRYELLRQKIEQASTL